MKGEITMDIITKFDRIEDILGSPDGRYFGNGYTQVKYFQKVKHITFEGIESVFEINYPKSWSTKKNIELIKPLFSSLDSIVLAVKLVSDFLREELVVEEDTINNALISSLSVKAGNSLVEDLKNVTAKLSLSSDDKLSFKGRIASFSVELVVDLFDDSKQLKINSGEDYYFSNFKTVDTKLTDISVKTELNSISATTSFSYSDKFSGIESAHLLKKRLPSILDHIIVTAELTEVLHSYLDRTPREFSKTLIMRKIKILRNLSNDSQLSEGNIKVQVLKTKIVPLKGKNVRVSDMISKLGESTLIYSVAQEL